MEQMMEDEELARSVTHSFLADLPQRMGRLQSCLERDDHRGAVLQVHILKGDAVTIGGTGLHLIATKMEKNIHTADFPAALDLMPELQREAQLLRQELSRHFYPDGLPQIPAMTQEDVAKAGELTARPLEKNISRY